MLPQTTPQQRYDMYEDLISLLQVGFLSVPVQIGPLTVSLRTLNNGDMFLVHQRAAQANNEDYRRWTLASSTWMAGGQILLEDYNAAVSCFDGYQGLRPVHLRILLHLLNCLTNRQARAQSMIDAFCLEHFSRSMWRQTGGVYPSTAYGGVPGATNLSMNLAQRIWIAHNRLEDIREHNEAAWSHAKMVASATSPKGVDQLNQKESGMRQTEEARKQEILDHAYYKWTGYLSEDGITPMSNRPVFKQASTPDELAEEMRKWVSGELDFHDQIVANYKQRALDAYQNDMDARQAHIDRIRQEMVENDEDPSALQLVGYTHDQLKDRISPSLHKTVYEAPKGVEYLHNRYLGPRDKGNIQVQDGGLVVPKAAPLDQQVAERTVQYGAEE
jgi:hypothetical protein